jgi:hypothetical protein
LYGSLGIVETNYRKEMPMTGIKVIAGDMSQANIPVAELY